MRKPLLTLALLIGSFFTLSAHILSGTVKGEAGEAIPRATIFIKEEARGILTDEGGNFVVELKTGSYTLVIRSMGYEQREQTVDVQQSTELNVLLSERVIALKEHTVVRNRKEDQAYPIMRKAISMAPFYLNRVESFQSENYIKGSFILTKFPTLFSKKVKIGEKQVPIADLMGHKFILENKSIISFSLPEKYEVNVQALNSSIPEGIIDGEQHMQPMQGSIYASKYMGGISPLSSRSFSCYKFKYIETAAEGDLQISKIEIIPKLKGANLLRGYIWIIEDSWSVHRVDLRTEDVGSQTHLIINYQDVQAAVSLPISFEIDSKMSFMGIKGEASYFASVKYIDIALNQKSAMININKEARSVEFNGNKKEGEEQAKTAKQIKTQKKIETLLAKEDLSLSQAIDLAKLLSSEVETEETKREKSSLEIKYDRGYDVKIDSLASKKDSIFWQSTRTQPLLFSEKQSYQLKDSLEQKIESNQSDTTEGFFSKYLDLLLTGETFKLNKKLDLSLGGVLAMLSYPNREDGLCLGPNVNLLYKINDSIDFNLSTQVSYAINSKRLMWNVKGSVDYAPLKMGNFSLSLGKQSQDIDLANSMPFILNSLFDRRKEPVYRFYDRKYLTINNHIELVHGLRLKTLLSYEEASPYSSDLHYASFENLSPTFTIPNPKHKTARLGLELQYNPKQYYSINRGRKHYLHSYHPTFGVAYKGAIPLSSDGKTLWSNYHSLEISIEQVIKTSLFGQLSYDLRAGKFLSKNNLFISDYKYFGRAPYFFDIVQTMHRFNTLTDYQHTNDKWVLGHLDYTNKYLLIKHLPFMQSFLFDEAIHASVMLKDSFKNPYVEFGYSIGFSQLIRVGVYVGGHELKDHTVSFRAAMLLPEF